MRTILIFIIGCCSNSLLFAQPQTFNSSGISGGSALFEPKFNPYNSDVIYMASDLTGMFYTENGGATWDVIPFYELRATPHSAMHFTSDPDILYTIYNDFIPDKTRIGKSMDGGKTWEVIPNAPTNGHLSYLHVDPQRTDRFLAVDGDHIYRSDDGGQSFETVYTTRFPDTGGFYHGGAVWDNEKVYIGTSDGLLVSGNGGQAFERKTVTGMNTDDGFLSISGKKRNGKMQLISTARSKNEMWEGMLPDGSDYYGEQQFYTIEEDENANFIGTNVSETVATFWDFPYYVARTQEESVLYSAGANINQTGQHIHPQVYKSTNEGENWTPILRTDANENIATGYMGEGGDLEWFWSENAMGFGTDPNDPNTAIVTDFSFVHITRDGGATWQALYVHPDDLNTSGTDTPKRKAYRSNGLENTTCWWLTWTDEQELFASYTDLTAVRSDDGGQSWSFDYDGLTDTEGDKYNTIYHIAEHPNGLLYASASSGHDIYQSTRLEDWPVDDQTGALFVSSDGSKTWELVHDFDAPIIWSTIDPMNSNNAYVSVVNSETGGIYKTENLSAGSNSSWRKLANPPRTEGHPFNIHALGNGELLCSYSGRRDRGLFTPSSGVFYSNDDGQTWQDRSSNEMLYWTKDVVLDPYDETNSTWYAGIFDGYSSHVATLDLGGLFRTKDKGISWEEIGDFYRVESVSIHPENCNVMYVTTESEGLWYTTNLNATNPTFQLLKSYPFQQPLRVFFNPNNPDDVWVTSYGNGLRKGSHTETAECALTSLEKEIPASSIRIYPNPVSDILHIDLLDVAPLQLQLYDVLGKLVYTKTLNTTATSIPLPNLANGVYTVEIRDASKVLKREKIQVIK